MLSSKGGLQEVESLLSVTGHVHTLPLSDVNYGLLMNRWKYYSVRDT